MLLSLIIVYNVLSLYIQLMFRCVNTLERVSSLERVSKLSILLLLLLLLLLLMSDHSYNTKYNKPVRIDCLLSSRERS